MIIVGQDKDMIINFDNINVIQINDFDDKSSFQRILAKTEKVDIVLGDYKTEERAKEVLKEISEIYDVSEMYGIRKTFKYEMPED